MYAQAAIKPNTLLRNGAYGIVMRGVQKCTRGCSSLRDRNALSLCCIKLDTATDEVRRIKPSIPLAGIDGIPLKHEMVFEYMLDGRE